MYYILNSLPVFTEQWMRGECVLCIASAMVIIVDNCRNGCVAAVFLLVPLLILLYHSNCCYYYCYWHCGFCWWCCCCCRRHQCCQMEAVLDLLGAHFIYDLFLMMLYASLIRIYLMPLLLQSTHCLIHSVTTIKDPRSSLSLSDVIKCCKCGKIFIQKLLLLYLLSICLGNSYSIFYIDCC